MTRKELLEAAECKPLTKWEAVAYYARVAFLAAAAFFTATLLAGCAALQGIPILAPLLFPEPEPMKIEVTIGEPSAEAIRAVVEDVLAESEGAE